MGALLWNIFLMPKEDGIGSLISGSSERIIVLILGLFFILVGLAGRVEIEKIKIGVNSKPARIVLGIIGFLITGLAIAMLVDPNFPPPPPTPTPTGTPTLTPTFTETPVPVTATPAQTFTPTPVISGFETCLQPCTGKNATIEFQAAPQKIYLQMQYQNIPFHAHVKRVTSMEGQTEDWAVYECDWPYASSGTLNYTFMDLGGIPSGRWTFTIEVNGLTVLKQSFVILGTFQHWSPAGHFDTCEATIK